MDAELADWDFKRVKKEARKNWNKQLSKIDIKSSKNNKTIFYTALYHNMIVPNTFMDVDGKYRGTDLEIHQQKKQKLFSLA